MKTFCVNSKIKLSRFLLDAYGGELSFSALNRLLRKKDVRINGVKTSRDVMLNVGDKVDVYFDGAPPKIKYNIIFSDDNVLIVYKPKGITSEAFYEMLSLEQKACGKVLYFCHRLDRNTDGIMVFAYNEESYKSLVAAFKTRTISKFYLAEVYGVMDKDSDTLSAYLFKDSKNSTVIISDTYKKGYLPIKTAYEVLSSDGNTSVVMVRLVTGRTHQIRAHLASIGHFVLGDGKYGDERINRALNKRTLCLTAYKLIFNFSEGDCLYYLNGRCFEVQNPF